MSLESAIKARLDAYTALRNLTKKRNYAITWPQSVQFPVTTFEILSESPSHAMGSDPAVTEARVRVSSWADDASKCREVDAQVRAALSRFRGSSGGTVIQDILVETVNDNFHPEAKKGAYQRARDFRVFFEVS